MKITITRSGGFAGLSRTWSILVDKQPDSDEWLSLVERLPWSSRPRATSPQPDRYSYRIQCSRRRVTLPEQSLDGPWRELVNRVQDRAEEENRADS